MDVDRISKIPKVASCSANGVAARVVVFSNTSWSVVNFRTSLVSALISEGFNVAVLAGDEEYANEIEQLGATFHSIKLDRFTLSPLANLRMLITVFSVLAKLNPNYVFSFTIKPNIYAACYNVFTKSRLAINVTGLGRTRTFGLVKRTIIFWIYRRSVRFADKVFFQNDNDVQLLLGQSDLTDQSKCQILPGSGVNLKHFEPDRFSPKLQWEDSGLSIGGSTVIIMCTRLLISKGVLKYCEAARAFRKLHPKENVQFLLIGKSDDKAPDAISTTDIGRFQETGDIIFVESINDIREALAVSDCIVLPTNYGEGTPKSLLEAAAFGLALITTSEIAATGALEENVNGFLLKDTSAGEIINSVYRYNKLSPPRRERFARASRKIAAERFSDEIIIRQYLKFLSQDLC